MIGYGRREFLKASAASGAMLLISPLGSAVETPPVLKPPDKIEGTPTGQSRSVRVEIGGMYPDLPGVISIDPGRVSVSITEATQGDRPEYRTYTYGQHQYEDLILEVELGPNNAKLDKWVNAATGSKAPGDAHRRDILVRLLGRDPKTKIRTYRCLGCLPVAVTPLENATGPTGPRVAIRCRVTRVEIF